jgi:hypothetical protein
MKNGWYKTADGIKDKLDPGGWVYVAHMNIVELNIPAEAEFIYCHNNFLTKLDLHGSVKLVNCKNNLITELIVPDDCDVYCDQHVNVITRTMYNRFNRLKNILK